MKVKDIVQTNKIVINDWEKYFKGMYKGKLGREENLKNKDLVIEVQIAE